MKNIHLLPTEEPSNLVLIKNTLFLTTTKDFDSTVVKFQNIYITSSEKIKKGDYVLSGTNTMIKCMYPNNVVDRDVKKIILTTDEDLIKDGVQAIDDKFLEWFVKNPSCEEVKVEKEYNCPVMNKTYDKPYINYKIIIPKVELFQESLGEVFNGKNTNTMWTDPKYKIIIPKEEQKQHLIDIMKKDEELGLYKKAKQETMNKAMQELIDWAKSLQYNQQQCIDWMVIKDKAQQLLEKEEAKKETLEEAAEKHAVKEDAGEGNQINIHAIIYDFISGAKWQQERMYSEEEVKQIIDKTLIEYTDLDLSDVPHWFIQFKKK